MLAVNIGDYVVVKEDIPIIDTWIRKGSIGSVDAIKRNYSNDEEPDELFSGGRFILVNFDGIRLNFKDGVDMWKIVETYAKDIHIFLYSASHYLREHWGYK